MREWRLLPVDDPEEEAFRHLILPLNMMILFHHRPHRINTMRINSVINNSNTQTIIISIIQILTARHRSGTTRMWILRHTLTVTITPPLVWLLLLLLLLLLVPVVVFVRGMIWPERYGITNGSNRSGRVRTGRCTKPGAKTPIRSLP